MKNTKNIQTGFAVVEILIITIVIAVLGFAGWYVIRSKSKTNKTLTSETSQNELAESQDSANEEPKEQESATPKEESNNSSNKQTSLPKCKDGTAETVTSKTVCTYSFTAKDVPARYEVFATQISPTLTQLYSEITFTGTCAPEGACEQFTDGKIVTKETKGRLDWKIIKEAEIKLTTDETVSIPGLSNNYGTQPDRKYQLNDFAFEHPKDPICTSNNLFCYSINTKFDKIQ